MPILSCNRRTQPWSSCHGYKQHMYHKTNTWPAHISPTCLWAIDPLPSPCHKIKAYCKNILHIFSLRPPRWYACISLFIRELYLAVCYLGLFCVDTSIHIGRTNTFTSTTFLSWRLEFNLVQGHFFYVKLLLLANTIHTFYRLCMYTEGCRAVALSHGEHYKSK